MRAGRVIGFARVTPLPTELRQAPSEPEATLVPSVPASKPVRKPRARRKPVVVQKDTEGVADDAE